MRAVLSRVGGSDRSGVDVGARSEVVPGCSDVGVGRSELGGWVDPVRLGCGLLLSCGDDVVHARSVAAGAEVAGTRNRRVADAAVVVINAISRAELVMILQAAGLEEHVSNVRKAFPVR